MGLWVTPTRRGQLTPGMALFTFALQPDASHRRLGAKERQPMARLYLHLQEEVKRVLHHLNYQMR